jgi:hypothetical protein
LAVTKDTTRRVGGKARFGLDVTHAMPSGQLEVTGEASNGNTTKRQRRVSRKFEHTNVTATFGGNEVHWEINPVVLDVSDKSDIFLEGDVFRSASTGSSVDACTVAREDGGPISSLVITGSVFINVENMIIENVSFMDKLGYAINIRNLAQEDPHSMNFRSQIFRREAKNRLLKQIIRKHLMSQGMKIDGASVEICRANT